MQTFLPLTDGLDADSNNRCFSFFFIASTHEPFEKYTPLLLIFLDTNLLVQQGSSLFFVLRT